ncbi:Alpha/Beta hydrolase protein [Cantharellus anzutake]|uniref:Alpha/Beta hydrolase protein n=1 Tax=Cantharellus anzutake TaxID=1750568 RepID=UPI0019065494|nr:Alpha/Beta hydrolase protein [Cantharellus anzutake]KAF8316200.1 Alpha/Beta hydrolase protein [Cantharellus anzutake]
MEDEMFDYTKDRCPKDSQSSLHKCWVFGTGPTLLKDLSPLRPPLPSLARETVLPSPSFTPYKFSLLPPPSDPASNLDYKPKTPVRPTSLRKAYPTVSSLDVLREIQRKGFSTSASSNQRPSGSSGWWFQHLEDVEPSLKEQDQGDSQGRSEAKIRKRYRAPKEPLVLVHGLLGFDLINVATVAISYWRGIKEALEAAGCEVLITRVPATSSIQERARVLERTVSENFPGRRGGLDCRYLVTHLRSDRFTPISVTTIATPHRGSSFADYFLQVLGRERMPSLLALLDKLPIGGGDGTAFETLTLGAMMDFNDSTPDADDVKYFSYGAAFTPRLLDAFKFPHSVILEKEGPNDGLVSVTSSQWGKYMGTLEDVNHIDLIGWISAARYAWAGLTGKSIKFKPSTFYLSIADMLADEVEGKKAPGAGSNMIDS